MKKVISIIAVVLAALVCDLALTYNNFIVRSDYFVKNDFEITQCKHPEKTWDKVFFGNSVVISAYDEDKSGRAQSKRTAHICPYAIYTSDSCRTHRIASGN